MGDQNYTLQCLEKIIKGILTIEKTLAPRLGVHYMMSLTRKPLCKFLNTMNSQVIDFFFGDSDQIKLLISVLKLDLVHVMRERITRDNFNFLQKLVNDYKQMAQSDSTLILRIIKVISSKNIT